MFQSISRGMSKLVGQHCDPPRENGKEENLSVSYTDKISHYETYTNPNMLYVTNHWRELYFYFL